MSTGRKASVLWHLLEEGTLTTRDLARLTGWDVATAASSLIRCGAQGLVQRADAPRTNPALYRLSPEGKEQAITKIIRDMVTFAPAAPLDEPVTADEKTAVTASSAFTPTEESTAGGGDRMLTAGDDVVCAINSKGILVVEITPNEAVMFSPKGALVLQRFLAGQTVLERLETEGSL